MKGAAEDFAQRLAEMAADPRHDSFGDWWSARCVHPDHQDDTPSLRFKDGDSALVVHCFGCSPNGNKRQWLAELHEAVRGGEQLPPPDRTNGHRTGGGAGLIKGEPVARYQYRDASGALLATKTRYESLHNGSRRKSFSWSHPYGEHSASGLPARTSVHDLPPYRLPELIAADPSAVVWVVEGEKDADRLRSLGQVATCSASGSGGTPRDLSAFDGRTVRIVADNDEPGVKAAARWAEALQPHARTVELLAPAVRVKGADVSDHLDAGHDLAELLPIEHTERGWRARTDEGGDWPDPVRYLRPAPTCQLPEAVRGTFLGDVAATVGDLWGVPPLMTTLAALGAASAATRGRCSVRIPNGQEFPLALYLMALAVPGSLKSPVMSLVTRPLAELQKDELLSSADDAQRAKQDRDALEAAIGTTTRRLAKALAGKGDPDSERAELDSLNSQLKALGPVVTGRTVILGADVTYEALINQAADNAGRVAVLAAEGVLIENLAGRYSDGAARTEFLNSSYDGEPYTRARVDDGTRDIPSPWASLTVVVQPDVIGTMLGSDHMRRRGFLQRFWPASIPPAPYTARHDLPAIPPELTEQWRIALARIWAQPDGTVLAEGPGTEALRQFEHQVIAPLAAQAADAGDLLMSGWLGKAAMTTVRVAAVMQLIEDSTASVVSEPIGRAAAELGTLMIQHAQYLFTGSPQAFEASPRGRVLRWLTQADKTDTTDTTSWETTRAGGSVGSVGFVGGVVSTRDVHRQFQDQAWCSTAEDARAVLADLAALDWIDGPHKIGGEHGGRPKECWRKHPRLAEHYRAMIGGATARRMPALLPGPAA